MAHNNRILVVAHRGASGLAPENTLASLRRALEIGVDAIEIDARRTRDGEIVLMHDANLKRTGNTPLVVAESTFSELRRVDVGAWFSSEFVGERVPTLAEVLALTKEQAVLCVEVKPDDITEDVVRVIAEKRAEDWVIVMSFYDAVVRRVRAFAPSITTGLIVGEPYGMDAERVAMSLVRRVAEAGASVLSLSHTTIEKTLAREIRRRGVALWTWTVDDPARMLDMADAGVDAIISNFPDQLKHALTSRSISNH